jgi:hypothetical protein
MLWLASLIFVQHEAGDLVMTELTATRRREVFLHAAVGEVRQPAFPGGLVWSHRNRRRGDGLG